MRRLNALTIDVEDYFHVEAFTGVVNRDHWDSFSSRVEANTERILSLLDEHGTRGTFFILGWVAERFPGLVQRIAGAGHELASHGYGHRLVYRLTPEQFRDDIRASIRAIQHAVPAAEIEGYRAPSFSITPQSQWALHELAEMGFRYDASIFPVRGHDLYGFAGAPRFAHVVQSGLWEIPASTVHWFGRNWPVAGGGYFRLLPLWLTRKAIHRINSEGHPAVVYLHPWEIDPHQPRVHGISLRSRFRHHVNLVKTEERLRSLLSHFSFAPIREVFREQLGESRGLPCRYTETV